MYANPNSADGTYAPPQIIPAEGLLSLRVGHDDVFTLPLSGLLP